MPSIKLKMVRLSFPDLFTPVQYQGKGKFRYNASFLIVPGSENDKIVQAAIKEAAVEKFGARADAILESIRGNSNKMCYVKGDLKEYDGYQGMLVLSGHRNQEAGKPGIYDCTRAGPDGKPLPLTVESGKPYAGCYVNASLDIYAQGAPNEGVRCGLSGVFFAKDGDAFSGSKVASPDDFEAMEEGADAAALV